MPEHADPTWVYDPDSNMGYVTVSLDEPIKETIEVHPQVRLDLDEDGFVLGIEVFTRTNT